MSNDYRLHKYAFEGKKSKLKALLREEENLNIDQLDPEGHTPLYYACFNSNKSCVKLLLEHNAKPNERCQNGETAVHAAACSGSTKILQMLLEYGGDLRLHDNERRAPKTWAMFQANSSLRRKMIAFIEEARYKAMLQTSKPEISAQFNFKIQTKSPDQFMNPCSVGFGTLYKSTNEIGIPIVLPAISESQLLHDTTGPTLNNGAFMVYESMKWKETHLVTVKRLHSNAVEGGCVDLLIDELTFLRRINHYPHIISLMGMCPTENVENMVLMFERISIGSLYNVLHEITLTRKPKLKSITEIMLSVCNALLYLHEQNIIHCYVNSHSIFLTSIHTAKLGNLEYAVEKCSDINKQKKSKVLNNQYLNCAWNWLAPELMVEDVPNELSDMYSFCVVFWELFNTMVPWYNMEWYQIKDEVIIENKRLSVDFDLIPHPLSRVIKDGFNFNHINRMSFEDVKQILESHYKTLLKTPKQRVGGTPASVDLKSNHQQQQQQQRIGKKLFVRRPGGSLSAQDDHRLITTNSFSEGIASLNDAVNSHEMATLNSLEEFDKFSQLSSGSFLYCDAYKTEIHLTKGGSSAQCRKSHSSLNEMNVSTAKRSNRLLRRSSNPIRLSRNENIEFSPSVAHNSNLKVPQVVKSNKNLPPLPKTISPSQKNQQQQQQQQQQQHTGGHTSRKQEKSPSVSSQNRSQHNMAQSQISSTNWTSQTKEKGQQKSVNNNLPPTPPPLPPPPPAPPLSNAIINQLGKANSSSTPQQHQLNQLLPLPPSFMMSPSPTPSNQSQRTSRIYSRSVDSPRSVNQANKQHESQQQQQHQQQQPKQGLLNKSELFEKLNQRAMRYEESQNSRDKLQHEINLDNNNNNNNNMAYETSNDDLDKSLAKLKRDKLRILESLCYSNSNKLSAEERSKIFAAFQRKHEQLLNERQQLQNGKFGNMSKASSSGASSFDYQDYESQTAKGTVNAPATTYLTHKFENFNDNLVRPTPDDKRRYFTMKVKAQDTTNQVPSPILNKKLDLSTLSQEENRIATNTSAANKKSSQNNAEFIPRMGSLNRLNEKKRCDANGEQQQQQQMAHNRHESRRSQAMRDSSSSSQPNQARFKSHDGSTSTNNNNQAHRETDIISTHGSVRSLVQSYEEFQNKERNEAENKVQAIRKERNKEIFEAVEKSKLVFISEHQHPHHQQDQEEHEEHHNQAISKEQQANKLTQSNTNQSQSNRNNNNNNNNTSVKMQKELSTISERTERTSSSINGCVAGMAHSNNTTTAAVSSSPFNANSQSRTTTITKSIRHLDKLFLCDSNNQNNTSNMSNSNHHQVSKSDADNKQQLSEQHQRRSAQFNELKYRYEMNALNDNMANNTKDGNGKHVRVYKHFVKSDNKHESDDDDEEEEEDEEDEEDEDEGDENAFDSDDEEDELDDEPIQPSHQHHRLHHHPHHHPQQQQQQHHHEKEYRKQVTQHKLNDAQRRLNSDEEACRNEEDVDEEAISPRKLLTRRSSATQSRKPSTNKSIYSSQEDFMSSLYQHQFNDMSNRNFNPNGHLNNELNDDSIEVSENVYVTDFDKFVSEQHKNKHLVSRKQKQQQQQQQYFTFDDSQAHQQQSLPLPPPPSHFDELNYLNDSSTGANAVTSNNLTSVTNLNNNKSNKYLNNSSSNVKSSKLSHQQQHTEPDSPSSVVAVSTAESLTESNSTDSINKQQQGNNKMTNVRMEKHYIDTSKYKGYSYKLETRSNLTNQYHITSLLTNEQTGHSFLLANTKVQTPKILTKVIIDQ